MMSLSRWDSFLSLLLSLLLSLAFLPSQAAPVTDLLPLSNGKSNTENLPAFQSNLENASTLARRFREKDEDVEGTAGFIVGYKQESYYWYAPRSNNKEPAKAKGILKIHESMAGGSFGGIHVVEEGTFEEPKPTADVDEDDVCNLHYKSEYLNVKLGKGHDIYKGGLIQHRLYEEYGEYFREAGKNNKDVGENIPPVLHVERVLSVPEDDESILVMTGLEDDADLNSLLKEFGDGKAQADLPWFVRSGQFNRLQAMKQITRGMIYVHQKKILHLDLKPKNVMTNNFEEDDKDPWFFVIIDWDNAIEWEKQQGHWKVVMTEDYAAPEMRMSLDISKDPTKPDVYSLGAMLLEMRFYRPLSHNLDKLRNLGNEQRTPEGVLDYITKEFNVDVNTDKHYFDTVAQATCNWETRLTMEGLLERLNTYDRLDFEWDDRPSLDGSSDMDYNMHDDLNPETISWDSSLVSNDRMQE